MRNFLKIFFLVASVFSFCILYSQKQCTQVKFKNYGADQGLAVTTAFSIVQDDNGFLWIASIDGLLRYDGYKFVSYKNNFNDSSSISDNTVSYLSKGKGNHIWMGTYSGGVNVLDANTGKFKRYQNNPNDIHSLSSNRVWSVLEDDNGIVWAGTDNGLNRIDTKTNKVIRYQHEEGKNSICENNILSLAKDKQGVLWIGTANGLSRAPLDLNHYVREFFNYKNNGSDISSLGSNMVMSFLETRDGSMFVGTTNGLSKFINSKNNFETTRFSLQPDSLSGRVYSYLNSYGDNAIRAMYEDKIGKLWLSTDKGLKILNPKTWTYVSYLAEPGNRQAISADLLSGMHEDKSGNLWIGSLAGGLNKVDLKPEKFLLCQTQYGNPANISKNNIRSIFVDSKNTLWIGTFEGGVNVMPDGEEQFVKFKDKELGTENIWEIFEDSKKQMWLGTSNGLYCYSPDKNDLKRYKFDKKNSESISNDIVRCAFEDSKGNLWIGTESGLNRFEYSSGTFTRFFHDSKNKNSISNNTIWTITETENTLWVGTDNGLNKISLDNSGNPLTFKAYFPEQDNKNTISNRSVRSFWKDKNGYIWIGTSNGLNKFDPKRETFMRFNEEDGMANAYIYGVLGDEKGNLWLSTNHGISKFELINSKFRNYDKPDGLQNNEFNTGAYFKAANGELFFGGPDGFNRFFPDSLSENKIAPPVAITSIKVFGEEYNKGNYPVDIKEITLKHDQNVISFEFSALDFTLPEKNLYSYRLVGFDKDWIKPGMNRFVSYTNLDPGEYTFMVKATNNDGTWNENGIKIKLTIVPPFWKTLWFQIAVVLGMIIFAYSFFKVRINRLRKTQAKLELQVAAKTRELREEKELVDEQNKLIEKKNNSITSSIRYAKRIQESILPIKEKLNDLIPESFIFFKPKDIVSGDFYWFTNYKGTILIAAADCTGHGVPGAFMSLIGNSLLNDIVKSQGIIDPLEILKRMHEGLVAALKKGEQESDTVDGMDITLCVINQKNKTFEVSSSGRSLLLIRNGQIKKMKVGKYPLGLVTKKQIVFEKETLELMPGDTFYLYTDGYCDQFGGADDDKYLDSNFEALLLKIQNQNMTDQSKTIETEIETWRGKNPQIDDMLVIGIRC
ncbi:MAG: SpoIIE family protein phosphatase [Bacteroidia bacterium]|nr:SpoIIE family protein phosphatase [Bacteroidia bacterium]